MFIHLSVTNCQRCFTVIRKCGDKITARKVHFCKSLRAAKAYAGPCINEKEVVEIFDESDVRVAHKCYANGKQKWFAN